MVSFRRQFLLMEVDPTTCSVQNRECGPVKVKIINILSLNVTKSEGYLGIFFCFFGLSSSAVFKGWFQSALSL